MSDAVVRPFIFELQPSALGSSLRVLTYFMPVAAYSRLRRAQGKKDRQSASFLGLDVLLAWAVPEVDLYRLYRAAGAAENTLAVSVIDPPASLDDLKSRIRSAVDYWLSTSLAVDEAQEIIRLLEDKRAARGSWQEREIDTRMVSQLAAEVPKDALLYDAVAIRAAQFLCRPVAGDGSGPWLPAGARRFETHAKEVLVSLPEPAGDGDYYWTHRICATAITSPETKGMRVALHVGVRNFGPIIRAPGWTEPSRTLDVFVPADAAFANGQANRWISTKLPLRRREGGAGVCIQPGGTLSALSFVADRVGLHDVFASFDGHPIVREPFYALPRLGSGHGDRWFAAGTGVSLPEREEFFQRLVARLSPGGFEALAPLARLARRPKGRWKAPFKYVSPGTATDSELPIHPALRQCVKDALGDGCTLHVGVFWQRQDAVVRVRDAISAVLGKPSHETPTHLAWPELDVALHAVPAEDLSREIDLSVTVPTDLPEEQRRKVEEAARQERRRELQASMAQYVARALPKKGAPIVCVLEMHDAVQGGKGDPYLLAQRAFAECGIGAQVVLWQDATDKGPGLGDDCDDGAPSSGTEKMISAVLDLLRTLGVRPMAPKERKGVTEPVPAVQAWWMVSRNSTDHESEYFTPVVIDGGSAGQLRVALCGEDCTPAWVSYLEAVCQLTLRKPRNLPKDTRAQEAQRFFAAVARQSPGRTIFCEATNLQRFVLGVKNSDLEVGRLALGRAGLSAEQFVMVDGGDKSLVRISLDKDTTPTYVVSGVRQGISTGIFSEQGTQRTFWVSRGLPRTLQTNARIRIANQQSRLAGADADVKTSVRGNRRFPSLTELHCVVAADGQSTDLLAVFTRWCMASHVTTTEETLLPFPLHEADLLGNHVR